MTKISLTMSDIRSRLPKEKRATDKDNLWVHYVMRPISHYATWLFLRLGISANQTTFAAMIIGIVGCGFIAFGNYILMFSGAVFLSIWALLESVDGNIARCTGSSSKYGAFIDDVNTLTISALLFVFVGIGAFNHPDPYLNKFFNLILTVNIDKSIFLFLGGWASLFYFVPRLIGSSFAEIILQGHGDTKNLSRATILGKSLDKIAYTVYNICGLVMPTLLLATIFKFLSIFLLLWALIHTIVFVILVLKLLRAAKSSSG